MCFLHQEGWGLLRRGCRGRAWLAKAVPTNCSYNRKKAVCHSWIFKTGSKPIPCVCEAIKNNYTANKVLITTLFFNNNDYVKMQFIGTMYCEQLKFPDLNMLLKVFKVQISIRMQVHFKLNDFKSPFYRVCVYLSYQGFKLHPIGVWDMDKILCFVNVILYCNIDIFGR